MPKTNNMHDSTEPSTIATDDVVTTTPVPDVGTTYAKVATTGIVIEETVETVESTSVEPVANPSATDEQKKLKNITCIIHCNADDDLSEKFVHLHDFKKKYGLKFSHHKTCIIFNLKSEHLTELNALVKFKVSSYMNSSQYVCEKDIADKLMSRHDSFLRMNYYDGSVVFSSRTPIRIHNILVRNLFKDFEQQFDTKNYIITTKNDDKEDHVPVKKTEWSDVSNYKNKSKYNNNKVIKEPAVNRRPVAPKVRS
jgi:hypothetical protein